MTNRIIFLQLLIALPVLAKMPDPVLLTPGLRSVPGEKPTPFLLYENPEATNVVLAGSWDYWEGRPACFQRKGIFRLDVRALSLPSGRHEFKFIVNGKWESGSNRILYANDQGLLERPPDVIVSATIDEENQVNILVKEAHRPAGKVTFTLDPPQRIKDSVRIPFPKTSHGLGYRIKRGTITFLMSEKMYDLDLKPTDQVAVAGNFNGWDIKNEPATWNLNDFNHDHIWELTRPLQGLQPEEGDDFLLFKFVINGHQWLEPPETSANATFDGKGNTNLRVDPDVTGQTIYRITTEEPFDLTRTHHVTVKGLVDKPIRWNLTPGKILDSFVSKKPLGVFLNKNRETTTYRIFAPRARSVYLCIFDQPYYTHPKTAKPIKPVGRYRLWKDPADPTWEITLLGLDTGKYYSYNVDGPAGDGEGFYVKAQVGDPYARAAAHAENNGIVIDPTETNQWFQCWTDQAHETINWQDAVIYETHVRDLTRHPSSGVPKSLRGLYRGILASEGTGTGLDHLKAMGFNTLELMPICEFNNGPRRYDWGYSTVFYFSPEASYAHKPLEGSQYFEFKHLINELHRKGFNVILDVVYNHVGSPNIFALIDRKYHFRLTRDLSFSNFSGVGNDVKTEAPMMRRLIVENIVYWMKEFHIDGFRFDLAELIDLDTMMAIRDAARAINPKVLLIAEPWSFRGENKQDLKGTGWSAWNNDFRYAVKDYVRGKKNRDGLRKLIEGSIAIWTDNPMQSVNYVESHDDMALVDELSTAPGQNGSFLIEPDVQANCLAATILFTSLGIPMIGEGQEFLRSKQGISNTYNKGDPINAIRWTDRDRPLAARTLKYYQGLIHMRMSKEGQAFRVKKAPRPGYYKWLFPAKERALGFLVNAAARGVHPHPGSAFIVLLNAETDEVRFQVKLPEGTWGMIGNGKEVDVKGLAGQGLIQGQQTLIIRVPGLSALIFRDQFQDRG